MHKILVLLAISGSSGLQLASAQAPGSVRLDPAPTLRVSQPSTPVPALQYTSSLAQLSKGVEQSETDWKTANANVGQFQRGHIDLLQWEKDQARKTAAPNAGAKP